MMTTQTRIDRRSRNASGSELQLRLHGPFQNGRLVTVAAPKCTVGAAASCDVQIGVPGVPDYAGLLIQGGSRTVFRTLTAANGASFEDRTLDVGDRVAVGPCELEIIANADEQENLSSGGAEYVSRLQRLETQFAELQQEYADSFQQHDMALETARRSNETIDQLLSQLAGERARHALSSEQWLAERRQLEADVEQLRRQLDEVKHDLDTRPEVSEHHAEELRESRDALAQQTQLAEELSQRLDEQHAEFAAEREQWSKQSAEWEAQLSEAAQRAEALQTQLDGREDDDVELRQQQDQTQAQLAQALQSLDELTAELEQQRLQHESESRELRASRQALESQLNEVRLELEEAQAAATAVSPREESGSTEDATAGFEMAPHEGPTEADVPSVVGELPAPGMTQPFTDPSEAADVPDTWHHTQPFAAADTTDATATDWQQPTDFAGPIAASYEPEPLAAPTPEVESTESSELPTPPTDEAPFSAEERETEPAVGPAAPVSAMDVLSRLGDVWSDEDEQVGDAQPMPPPLNAIAEPPAASAWSAPSNSSSNSDDDDSIEEYMNRLLQRVGGSTSATPASHAATAPTVPSGPAAPTASREPVMEAAVPANAPAADEPAEPMDPSEFRPRSQAPEAGMNLDAMRSLANASARTAIAEHAKQTWSSWLKVKLIASFVAATAVAYGMMFKYDDVAYLVLGSIFGVVMMLYWGTQLHAYRQLSFTAFLPAGQSATSHETTAEQERGIDD